MAYEGTILTGCGEIHPDFTDTYVVLVSGVTPCGHVLIFDRKGGYYFHAVGDPEGSGLGELTGYPLYMNQAGYARYLAENGKKELRRRPVDLPDPAGARDYIENRLSSTWTWLGLPHNCVTFAESVIAAGGGSWSSYSNCPKIAMSDSLSERIERFYDWLESGVYEMRKVPRY
jgi:hypothetical protein